MTSVGGSSKWRRTLVVLAAIAVSLGGLILVTQVPAGAHDHRPPNTVLMKGTKELQKGRLTSEFVWSYPSRNGNSCITDKATFLFGFPTDVPTVAVGSKLKVRIHKSHEPESFRMAEVDRRGVPKSEVGVLLKPVVRDGKTVAWDAVFALESPNTDYRLFTEGHWQDRDCSGSPIDPEQLARWTFRVKTGNAS